ncbi:MAG: hypothetical protein HY579_03135 [Nitrospinae bacterium]|nr:hypothetical protein [Nitrospinota bacterium]
MDEANKSKYDQLMDLLGKGDAMVCLDARSPGVDVPAQHKTNPTLNLIFNLNFRRPLEITDRGIFTTLSFQGRPHKCAIPFESVWAIYDPNSQMGQVWEESIPKDIDLVEQAVRQEPAAKTPKTRAVKKPAAKPRAGAEAGKPRARKDRSHLRVIK